jgi:hypothetical protein
MDLIIDIVEYFSGSIKRPYIHVERPIDKRDDNPAPAMPIAGIR